MEEIYVYQVNTTAAESAAYREADAWAQSDDLAKAKFGQLACQRILNGEDHDKVLDEMKSSYDAFKVAQEEG